MKNPVQVLMDELDLSVYKLAQFLDVPHTTLGNVVNGVPKSIPPTVLRALERTTGEGERFQKEYMRFRRYAQEERFKEFDAMLAEREKK